MRVRTAAVVASRVLAIYVAFTSIIFAGELIKAIIERQPAGAIAEPALPAAVALTLALVLWFAAPAVAARLAREPLGDDDPPARAREIALIAFTVAGLYIAAQALPLAVHALARIALAEGTARDVTADLVSAAARTGIGVTLALLAPLLSRRLFPASPR
ncbi:MAG TPA: hypothetical protein VM841_14605 [Actinomycetota bacterium]|nr:hypothetical protein [Actinomycetota bacterium]